MNSSSNDTVFPLGVPIKFHTDGTVQRYAGNTIICHLPAHSCLHPALKNIHDAYKSHETLSKYVRLMPPSSWHVTIFDGVREVECEPGMWPEGLKKDPLPQATATFSKILRESGQELKAEGLAPPYKFRVCGFDPSQVGMGLAVEGATSSEEQRLRRLRDWLADQLGFRAPNHLRYGFHMTIAYLLLPISGEDKVALEKLQEELLLQMPRDFNLGPLELCTFENMEAYHRLFYL
ncbi:hypothetical protein KCU77_g336, partial [Aureobasidium melanogenum]